MEFLKKSRIAVLYVLMVLLIPVAILSYLWGFWVLVAGRFYPIGILIGLIIASIPSWLHFGTGVLLMRLSNPDYTFLNVVHRIRNGGIVICVILIQCMGMSPIILGTFL